MSSKFQSNSDVHLENFSEPKGMKNSKNIFLKEPKFKGILNLHLKLIIQMSKPQIIWESQIQIFFLDLVFVCLLIGCQHPKLSRKALHQNKKPEILILKFAIQILK